MTVRSATPADSDAIWNVLEPTIRAGETYTMAPDWTKKQALAFWLASDHSVFVSEENGTVVGTYFLRANQQGGGAHVANCGYVTAPWATGRGVARKMFAHSLDYAKALGFRAMQFSSVVSTNERAVRLWQSFGFQVVGKLPKAFLHPRLGYVDSFAMYRFL